MSKRIFGIIIVLVALTGCGDKQGDSTEQVMMQPSENAVAYDCSGEVVKVDFNSDVDPRTAELFFMAKNTNITLLNVESGSGDKYSDGDVVFWTHQGEATLAMEGAEQSLKCVEQK